MKVGLMVKKDDEYKRVPVHDNFTFDERLDEELDGGAVISYTSEEMPLAEFTESKVHLEDSSGVRQIPFYAFDDVQKRAKGRYMHNIELIEPTRWIMGITCDGLKVTQPIDNRKKKTLHYTLERVLRCCNTQTTAYGNRGILNIDEGIYPLLDSVISPEFAWQAQTLLFEILQDIADVVDCVPRIVEDRNGEFTMLTLVKINEVTGEYIL